MTAVRIPTALRASAAVAALLAAVGAGPVAGGAPVLRVVAVDVSASIRGPSTADPPAWFEGLGSRNLGAVVEFADGAVVAARPASPEERTLLPHAPVGNGATSITAALRLADSLRTQGPAGAHLEVVVVTDGRATDRPAELRDAALALRRSGGASLRFVVTETSGPLPAVATLRGPGRAAAGEPFSLVAEGRAPPAGGVVELLDGTGVVDSRTVAGGPFRVAFARIGERPGMQTWRARLAGAAAPPASSSVVLATPGAAAVLARTLRPELAAALGGDVVDLRVAASGGPRRADLAAFGLVVVDDLGDTDLGDDLVRALDAFAADGGGVLLCGGESSFGAGGWGGRPADALSPLRSLPPDDAGSFVYVALDASGSMAEEVPAHGGPPVRRDDAVRAAAVEFVRGAASGTHVRFRRFRESLIPDARAELGFDLTAAGREEAARWIGAFGAPGGSTALLPPLREALEIASSRGERRRAALFLTDGRSSEPEADVRAAVQRLLDAGIRLTVVTPRSADGSGDAVLLRAVAGTAATVRPADDAGDLAAALLGAERDLRAVDPFAGPADLVAAAGADGVLAPGSVPPRAGRRNRAFAAPGAQVLVSGADGIPFAAIADRGRGRVGAIAAHAADAGWIDGDGAALLRGLANAVRRRSALDVRVERGSDGFLLVRSGTSAEGDRPVQALVRAGAEDVGRLGLRPAGDGVFRSDGPVDPRADGVVVVGSSGGSAACGLDLPAPVEYRDPPRADLDALTALAGGPAPADGGRPSWPLCALAVALLAASAFKWGPRSSR